MTFQNLLFLRAVTNISKSFQNNTFNALSREATLIYYPFAKGIDQDLVHAV